jgi:uncharacterized coiled-coil protein SlyX
MSEKKIEKVCIDCINANEHLKISTDFRVSVEFGTCDCCDKRYIIVPFRRFFSENVKITPCNQINISELQEEISEEKKITRELQKRMQFLTETIGKLGNSDNLNNPKDKEAVKPKNDKSKDDDKVYE